MSEQTESKYEQQTKKQRQGRKYPGQQSWTTQLPKSGHKVRITAKYATSTVERPVRVWGRKVRNKKGEIVKVDVPVPACFVTISFPKETKKVSLSARSCCKPPDLYDWTAGRKFALKHLFEKSDLAHEDREHIMRVVCPRYFKKVKTQ